MIFQFCQIGVNFRQTASVNKSNLATKIVFVSNIPERERERERERWKETEGDTESEMHRDR